MQPTRNEQMLGYLIIHTEAIYIQFYSVLCE